MSDERGFTLLEVLVAFVIAAMAVAVLVEGVLGGLRSADVAGRYEEAIARARSRLAALGTNIVAGDTQGDDGGSYHWHLRVAPNASKLIASDVVRGAGTDPPGGARAFRRFRQRRRSRSRRPA